MLLSAISSALPHLRGITKMLVAIVLGNRMNNDGSLSEKCLKRLELAKKVDKLFSPDKIILSGGLANPTAGITEAQAMFDRMVEDGMDKDKLVLEDKSLSTVENAKYSVPLAKIMGADEIIVITTLEHMSRKYYNAIAIFMKEVEKVGGMKLSIYSGD